jgi:trimeric autotransporter adhesin
MKKHTVQQEILLVTNIFFKYKTTVMKINIKFPLATALLFVITTSGIKAQNRLTAGNNGTNAATHLLGTTDSQALVLRPNNIAQMQIPNTGNVGLGTPAPSVKLQLAGGDAIINGLTVGRGNGAIATNIAVGDQALFSNTTGESNTAQGWRVLYNNTTGSQNTGSGRYALHYNTTGSNNTALGFQAFKTGATFSNSTALGANTVITENNQVTLGDAGITSLYCKGAYAATTASAPNMYVNASGQIMRSTAPPVGGAGWLPTGNSGTIDGTNFIGTTDNVPLNIMVNSQKAGRIDHFKFNTFYGYQAGNANTSGIINSANGYQALFSNTTGYENTANGVTALYSNISGNYNTANGAYSLFYNTTGGSNTAHGYRALYSNTSASQNTAYGAKSLLFNTMGSDNTATGFKALYYNTTGNENTANGVYTLFRNTTGYDNTAFGMNALYWNTEGVANTAIGSSALFSNTTGSNNTALGFDAGAATGDLTNATALGSGAVVNNSNTVRIGNQNVTVVESAGGFWTTSDGRFKTNITEDVKGLEFIKLLRPVVYNFDANKFETFITQNYPDSIKSRRKEMMNKSTSKLSSIRQTGFIAQEVAMAAKKSGYDFNGVHAPDNPTDNYSISYEKLVVPLVKAVQELSNKNDALQLQNDALQSQNDVLKTRLDKIEQMLTTRSKTFESISSARLEQNAPNPYKGSTIINYYVPFNTGKAVIKITDIKGSLLKTFNLIEGTGQVVLQSSLLAAGTYQYSLFINDRLTDTKQMILIR